MAQPVTAVRWFFGLAPKPRGCTPGASVIAALGVATPGLNAFLAKMGQKCTNTLSDEGDENRLLHVRQLMREGKFKGASTGAIVPVEMQLADQTKYPYKGVINFVDPELDPKTGTLQLRGAALTGRV